MTRVTRGCSYLRLVSVTAVAMALLFCAVPAQSAAPTLGTGSTLTFGTLVAGTTIGTVTVTPGSVRSATGGVTLVASGAGSATSILVSGTANTSYSITLPLNGTVTLTGPGTAMAVNNFVSIPSTTAGSGMLSAGGTQTLLIGATLNVGVNQIVGGYSGTYTVTVTSP